MNEPERVRDAYARQAAIWQDERYRSWMPGNIFIHQERERVALELLRRHGRMPLTDRRILDVGCGSGKALLDFIRYGARPENLAGIDLLEDQIEVARRLGPHADFRVADATGIPFPDSTFDLALAFTSFSSMLPKPREAVAAEIRRVLRPGGALLAYDFWVNPPNPDNSAVRLGEIRRLFPGCDVDARRLTLAPPVARALASRSWLACALLAKVPILRTHWLAFIEMQ